MGRICKQIPDSLIPVQGTRTTIFYFTLFHSQFDPIPPLPPKKNNNNNNNNNEQIAPLRLITWQ